MNLGGQDFFHPIHSHHQESPLSDSSGGRNRQPPDVHGSNGPTSPPPMGRHRQGSPFPPDGHATPLYTPASSTPKYNRFEQSGHAFDPYKPSVHHPRRSTTGNGGYGGDGGGDDDPNDPYCPNVPSLGFPGGFGPNGNGGNGSNPGQIGRAHV